MAALIITDFRDRLIAIQDLLTRFGNEVDVMSPNKLDNYKEEISSLNTAQYLFISEILTCYKTAARLLYSQDEKFRSALAAKEHIIAEKERNIKEKGQNIKEKEQNINEKERNTAEKERIITEKDLRIAEKDKVISVLENHAAESKNYMEPLLMGYLRRYAQGLHKHGSITRTNAWKSLMNLNRVCEGQHIPPQTPKNTRDSLEKALLKNLSKWHRESDMYQDIIDAMGLLHPGNVTSLSTGNPILVQGTFKNVYFRADISVASQFNKMLPSTVLYFVELKGLTTPNAKGDEHCGQILDYFNDLHAAQENRREFVAVLSNGQSSWVFEACYEDWKVTITERSASNLADAIMYADALSRTQYDENGIPALDEECFNKKGVIALRQKHTLLSVERRVQGNIKQGAWEDPFGSRTGLKIFVLKTKSRKGRSETMENETRILQKIRSKLLENPDFIHVPQLVWKTQDQLGIMPCGRPIDLDHGEPASISRRIVGGLMDGLQFLHTMNIIHRDIRPSNLVLFGEDDNCHVMIIDYETAVDDDGQARLYEGGAICQPNTLLWDRFTGLTSGASDSVDGNESHPQYMWYVPKKEHDLYAAILVVLYLLFPRCFRQFPVWQLEDRVERIKDILDLWETIECSEIWKPYLDAAKAMDYAKLKKMADIFCALPRVTI